MSLAPPTLPKDTASILTPAIPVPTHGDGGTFTVACSTTIRAPAAKCFEKVIDLDGYSAWNTFITKASVVSPSPSAPDAAAEGENDEAAAMAAAKGLVPGAKLKFDAVMTVGSAPFKTDIEVSSAEMFESEGNKGYRVCWKAAGMPHFLLHSERVQEFIEVTGSDGGVETRYLCWETFGGWISRLVPRSQVENGFLRWMTSLKKVAEEEAK